MYRVWGLRLRRVSLEKGNILQRDYFPDSLLSPGKEMGLSSGFLRSVQGLGFRVVSAARFSRPFLRVIKMKSMQGCM